MNNTQNKESIIKWLQGHLNIIEQSYIKADNIENSQYYKGQLKLLKTLIEEIRTI